MVEDFVRQYVNQVNIMQLATCSDNQPWVVTVHFYADDDLNFYWTSRPDRRHSKELAVNPKVSSTALVHENTSQEDWVIGLTVSGEAKLIENVDAKIAQAYIGKLLKDPNLPANIKNGTDPAKWYILKPTSIIWFDTKNFPTDPRQQWQPAA
jgi:nitroimidazol reductase NimA-like FMN-containing flavoprotein (pyridoxamine 5'-phosphate oxidase superfamily)